MVWFFYTYKKQSKLILNQQIKIDLYYYLQSSEVNEQSYLTLVMKYLVDKYISADFGRTL